METTQKPKKRHSMAFLAHYVENWNWLLKWRPFQHLHCRPEDHVVWLPLWPIYTIAAIWEMFGRRAFDVVDNFSFGGSLRCRTVLLRNFAWQFFVPKYRSRIKERILRSIIETQNHVEVIGLGALVKDEGMTQGGEWIVNTLGSQLKVPIVHGDTLTAATVYHQVVELRKKRGLDPTEPVMLTGSTSKIGRAVALLLAKDGVRVKMYTMSEGRFSDIRNEAADEHKANLEWAKELTDGKDCQVWVTGKSIPRNRELLRFVPYEADVLNFAVPNPVSKYWMRTRPDLCFNEVGLLAYDKDSTDLRFTMRLRPGLTYACHAGTMVHAYKGWTHHEVGAVDIATVEETWDAARELGFSLPLLGEHQPAPQPTGQLRPAHRFLNLFF